MKSTFYNLDEDKRRRIEEAALEEFGIRGYERGSTDRIIRLSGISKGALYEYIESKEDLFLHVVERSYGALYDWIQGKLRVPGGPPADILERVMAASSAALDFYLANPPIVRLLSHLALLEDPEVRGKSEDVFGSRFRELFDSSDFTRVRFPKEQVMELIRWLLVKTRNDFLRETERLTERTAISSAYLDDWKFLLSVLADGIYAKRGT